jgi:hypothetical protein
MQQNNIDFTKSYGKARFQVEIRQNPKAEKEFIFSVNFVEIRDLIPVVSGPVIYQSGSDFDNHHTQHQHICLPYVEVVCLGPKIQEQSSNGKWAKKYVKYANVDHSLNAYYFKENVFEFRMSFASQDLLDLKYIGDTFLSNHELQINVYDSVDSNLIGISILNLNEVYKSALVWKRLKLEDESLSENFNGTFSPLVNSRLVYGAMDLWLHLRPRLKMDPYGDKILKVLDRHVGDRCAIEFIKLKMQSRNGANFYKN